MIPIRGRKQDKAKTDVPTVIISVKLNDPH